MGNSPVRQSGNQSFHTYTEFYINCLFPSLTAGSNGHLSWGPLCEQTMTGTSPFHFYLQDL